MRKGSILSQRGVGNQRLAPSKFFLQRKWMHLSQVAWSSSNSLDIHWIANTLRIISRRMLSAFVDTTPEDLVEVAQRYMWGHCWILHGYLYLESGDFFHARCGYPACREQDRLSEPTISTWGYPIVYHSGPRANQCSTVASPCS